MRRNLESRDFVSADHATAHAPRPGTVAANVVLALLTGTLVCFWFWRNTDWFEELGAVLTFSGALSWLAVFLKIVPDDKTGHLKQTFFRVVFENPRTKVWLGLGLVLVAAGSFCFATVQLEPLQEPVDRAVIVYPLSPGENTAEARARSARVTEGEFDTLKPGGRLRVLAPVWWGWQRQFVVKVSGYPDKVITLHPWQRLALLVPNSFRRPVVVLRPTQRLMNNVRQHPWTLIVRREKPPLEIQMPVDGHSIWLGCDRNVQLPAAMRSAWEGGIESFLKPLWFYPQAATNFTGELAPGERISLQLKTAAGALQPPKDFEVAPPEPRQDFYPQVVEMDSAN